MTYRQLSPEERYMLAALRRQGLNQADIARSLGRHRSTVPVKLQLTNAAGVPEDAGNSNPDSGFRYDAGVSGYVFNLKTTGYAPGTYVLTFRVAGDPTAHTTQFRIAK